MSLKLTISLCWIAWSGPNSCFIQAVYLIFGIFVVVSLEQGTWKCCRCLATVRGIFVDSTKSRLYHWAFKTHNKISCFPATNAMCIIGLLKFHGATSFSFGLFQSLCFRSFVAVLHRGPWDEVNMIWRALSWSKDMFNIVLARPWLITWINHSYPTRLV